MLISMEKQMKQFDCPFCGFQVKAGSEEEILKYVTMHRDENHADKDVSEEEIKNMIKIAE